MATSKDPLVAATTAILWPFLRDKGFTKSTSRTFVREKEGVFHQLWIDANGVRGKESTVFVLCATLVFSSPKGYMDPLGFRIRQGRSWNMTTSESANASMRAVVNALEFAELPKLDRLATLDDVLAALKASADLSWYDSVCPLVARWQAGDPELLATADNNRVALKLWPAAR